MRHSSFVVMSVFAIVGCGAAPTESKDRAAESAPEAAKQPAPASEARSTVEQPPNPAEPKPTEPKPAEPKPTAPVTLASFETFLGLHSGDKRERVHELFGEPTYLDDEDDEMDTLHYVMTDDTVEGDGPPQAGDEFLFAISINKPSQWVYTIQANAGDYAAAGIHDPLLRFVGAPLSEIKATFGDPLRSHAGFNTYEYADEDRKLDMQVQFLCYDFDDFACNEVWVMWFEL